MLTEHTVLERKDCMLRPDLLSQYRIFDSLPDQILTAIQEQAVFPSGNILEFQPWIFKTPLIFDHKNKKHP